MTILSWNCRGIGQPRTVQELVRLVHAHRPKIVFLCETRQLQGVVEKLRWRLGLKKVVSFEGDGKGGGLAMLWEEGAEVELLKKNSRFIDVYIHNFPIRIKWRCTFVYGEPSSQLRHLMWDLVRRIRPMAAGPWLMAGDFNEVMWQGEHISARRRNEGQMAAFRNVLSECDLHDLGYSGHPWTFDNKQMGHKNVRVRLDRAVATPDWSTGFPHSRVEHLVSSRSDHCPILISLYEEFWERDEQLPKMIDEAWHDGAAGYRLGSDI